MSNLPSIRPDYWLRNAASLAMSSLLARLDLDQAARPYFWIDIRQSPPQASHSYWDDIERIARNQLLENQSRDETTLRQLYPGIDEAVLAMMHGGFECAAFHNRLLAYSAIEACCIGGGLRALYHVWRGAISETSDTTHVHLGFSRATLYVDVIGYEPWRGRIDVRLHTPRRLAIRAPGHIALDAVMVTLDGQSIEPTWSGRYAHLDGLTAGQVITLTYPLQERQANYAIAGQPYTGWWRGATMVEIQPPGEGYPIYQCRHLVADDLSVQDPALIDVSNQPFSELSLW